MAKNNQNATLLSRRVFNDELAEFRIRYNDHPVPEFKPGQYATLGLPQRGPVPEGKSPKLVRRAYSVASPATDTEAMSFYIVKVQDGALTPSLFDLADGEKLFMSPRLGGHFTLDGVPDGKDLVMVGTGTGLAPFRSMYLTYRGDRVGGRGRWNRFVMIEGCRYARDLGYSEEMQGYAREDPNFVYLPTVTREPDDAPWPGLRGRVNALLEPAAFEQHAGFALSPENAHVFLCGNPQMIDQVEADFESRGFVVQDRKHPDGNLHFERYW